MSTSSPSLRRCRRSPLALLVIALLAPALASAQDGTAQPGQDADKAPTELDKVVVNAYRTVQHVSTATKTDTALIETPQSVSVVSRDELDARGVRNLNDAVRYNAGVLAEPGGIDNRVDDVYIRGFDVGSWSSNVTLDGLRMPKGGQWTTVQVDNWNMDRIELLKGPSAVMYGQVAPGGMINQVSKTPDPTAPQQLRLGVDNHGQYQAAIDIGGNGGRERDAWRLVGLFSDGDTQIDDTARQHWFVAPSYTFQLGQATRLTLLGLYQQDEGGSTFQFLPYQGTMTPAAEGYIKNNTFIGEPDWNVYDRTTWTAGWLFEHAFNERWTLSQSARYSHVDTLFRTTVGGTAVLTNGRLLGRRAVQGIGDADGSTIDTRLEGKFDTGAVKHTGLAGFDWQSIDWTHLRQAARVTPAAIAIDVFHPVYTHYDFAPTLFAQSNYDANNRQSGLYLQDQMAIGNWRVNLGGRYDWFDSDVYEAVSGDHARSKDKALTANAGLLYASSIGLSPYLSYSESFQPVVSSSQTRDGSELQPTEGKQWELGLKYQPGSFDGMITLAAFDLREKNKVTADPSNVGDEDFVIQTGEYRVRGIELEGRVTPLDGFSIIGAATRMQSEITRDNGGNLGHRMINVPDWMGSLWLDYTFASGFSIAAGGRYVGDLYGDVGNNFHIPAYGLFDAALRYQLRLENGRSLRLSLNASNLADKRYVSTCTAVTACFYGSGRSINATATFSW